jgi:hypothetical protein
MLFIFGRTALATWKKARLGLYERTLLITWICLNRLKFLEGGVINLPFRRLGELEILEWEKLEKCLSYVQLK